MKFIRSRKSILMAIVIALFTYFIFFGALVSPNKYFWGDDAKGEYVPARTYFYEKVVHEHSFPFWTERMFFGYPIYADLENSYLNPVNDLSILIFGPLWSYKILHLAEYLLGSLSLYFLLKRKNIGIFGYTAANLIFYFNTFLLNRQIHFNIIMAFYLIPTALLLADLYIEKKQLRYILLQSFVVANAVLWGHMQSAIIVCVGIGLYMMVFFYKKLRVAPLIFYFIALLLLVTAETLPQIVPTYNLYKSINGREGLSYMAGAFRPAMAMFTFLPFLLGNHNNFDKMDLGTTYNYNETYIYLGISSIILSFLALLFLKKNRLTIFSYLLIWVFLIFSFKFLNKFTSSHTPILSLFRYWSRMAVFCSLGVAILAGFFVDRIKEISLKKSLIGIFFVGLPIIYIWAAKNGDGPSELDRLISFHYIQHYPYYEILKTIVLSLAAVLLFVFFYKKIPPQIGKKILLPLKIALIAVVLIDLFYINKDVLAFRLQDISNYKIHPVSAELENKRIVALNEMSDCMETVYYKNWGPLGCSQLKDGEYHNFYKENIRSFNLNSKDSLQKLKDASITAVIQLSGEVFPINNKKIDLIKNDLNGEYIEKKEGKIIMNLVNPSDTVINTYLKYDPFWRVMVDGKSVSISKNGIFFNFPLSAGTHNVKIYYYPKPFIWGIELSLILSIILFALYYFFKKPLYEKILNRKSI